MKAGPKPYSWDAVNCLVTSYTDLALPPSLPHGHVQGKEKWAVIQPIPSPLFLPVLHPQAIGQAGSSGDTVTLW